MYVERHKLESQSVIARRCWHTSPLSTVLEKLKFVSSSVQAEYSLLSSQFFKSCEMFCNVSAVFILFNSIYKPNICIWVNVLIMDVSESYVFCKMAIFRGNSNTY
jgi:hypothetical protein